MVVEIEPVDSFIRKYPKKPEFIDHICTDLINRDAVIEFLNNHRDWEAVLYSIDGSHVVHFTTDFEEYLTDAWRLASKFYKAGEIYWYGKKDL